VSDRTGGNGVGRRPLGVVVASALDGARTLVGKHLELARAEAGKAASVRATGAGLMAAAAVLCVFAVVFLGTAASAALDLVLPRWAANLLVAVALLAVAGSLVLIGRRMIRKAPAPTARTEEMLKEDARWLKRQIER
jgi:hypothetical protein